MVPGHENVVDDAFLQIIIIVVVVVIIIIIIFIKSCQNAT